MLANVMLKKHEEKESGLQLLKVWCFLWWLNRSYLLSFVKPCSSKAVSTKFVTIRKNMIKFIEKVLKAGCIAFQRRL